ncbi:hypothetical protein EIN_155330 [Entamoeba invadens IP1]|uniref:Uncharacterized protein n=1 Tax=Entamoeba invadens IP1 TaxID=370355 RepID=A0A0A1UF51_ENTIV|nr:hypothetical protein EIN_155330 [Entamoeba invadens IP1]ELP91426.1 hypothetical protein EIN_155330 [Entamoeba invadens IP1]|eukprot:XP_004258197.1 hypothetical protein EIN_155330 [Entamoeba invadens IP1]
MQVEVYNTINTITKKAPKLYKDLRNYQVYQQAVLIALLNQHADIIITPQKKKSNVTLPFFTIKSVVFSPTDRVDLTYIVEKRCKQQMEMDVARGISSKTAMRRYKTNRVAENLHMVLDLLFEFDNLFVIKTTNGKNGANRLDTVTAALLPNNEWISYDDITEIGSQLNSFIANMLTQNESITLGKGSDIIAKFLRI